MTPSQRRFQTAAWLVYAYVLLVIIGGAVVRITGSGAGCGQHWPTCHGEIVPTASSIKTMIEYTHRLTSGLSILALLGLLVGAYRAYPVGDPVRQAARVSVFFIFTESLIGAAIVLLRYVEYNESYWRAAWMAVHLANTFALAAAVGRVAWLSARSGPRPWVPSGRDGARIVGVVVLMLLLGSTGAIAALGNTLFPVDPHATMIEHVIDDRWANSAYPMIVRMVHPLSSLAAALWLGSVALHFTRDGAGREVRRAGTVFGALLALQVLGGIANIYLSAPGWMQIVHLATAQFVWLALVVLSFEVAAEQKRASGAVVGGL